MEKKMLKVSSNKSNRCSRFIHLDRRSFKMKFIFVQTSSLELWSRTALLYTLFSIRHQQNKVVVPEWAMHPRDQYLIYGLHSIYACAFNQRQ